MTRILFQFREQQVDVDNVQVCFSMCLEDVVDEHNKCIFTHTRQEEES